MESMSQMKSIRKGVLIDTIDLRGKLNGDSLFGHGDYEFFWLTAVFDMWYTQKAKALKGIGLCHNMNLERKFILHGQNLRMIGKGMIKRTNDEANDNDTDVTTIGPKR